MESVWYYQGSAGIERDPEYELEHFDLGAIGIFEMARLCNLR